MYSCYFDVGKLYDLRHISLESNTASQQTSVK
jgi:hypothetical protein